MSRDIDLGYWKNLEDFDKIFVSLLIYIVLMNIFRYHSCAFRFTFLHFGLFFSPPIADT